MSYTESYYAILGVSEDASHQEIKQAYKKAALRTHPDRALPERKSEAEANFKKVAEAYETLSDTSSRNRYDRYGTPTSPPPMSSRRRGPSNDPGHTYFGVSPDSQPFSFQWESSHDSAKRAQAQRGDGSRRPFNHHIDPFQLFNEMFAREFSSMRGNGGATRGGGDDMFDDHPFFANHRRMADTGGFGFGSPFGSAFGGNSMMDSGMGGFGFDSPFSNQGSNSMAATRRDPFQSSPFGQFSNMMSGSMMQSSSSMSMSNGGQSESRSTRTINGRTETIIRKVDAQGNQTIHTISPEGQSVHVNGVEQPNHPLLQQGSTNRGALPGPQSQGWFR